jgi:U2-associated protein SR140
LRLIHKTLENLLNYGPEFEALLMSRPEVQKEEKWAWIWDARSPGGVYYRWKLWQIITNPRAHSKRKTSAQKLSFIFEGGATWASPETELKFEYTTRLDEFVSEDDYNSSEEEMSDGEEERRNLGGGPPPEGTAAQNDSLGYMNPLQRAKLTHLLARLPTTHAKLRRGDVARVTAFAIKHAGTGAREVVDMIVLNILNPLAYTGANPERETEKDAARQEDGDKDNSNPSKQKIDMSSAKLVGLYLISDILASSATSGVPKGWRYRSLFEAALRSHNIFEHLGRLEKELNWGRLRAEKWKRSVGTLLHLWEGWSIFQPANQEHFLRVLEQPPLTEEELQKESEKVDAERAAHSASKSKSRWKTVDDDPASGKFDSDRPAVAESEAHPVVDADAAMEDESMSDLDGVPMEDSDLEMLDDDGEPMEEDAPPLGEGDTLPSVPDQPSQPEHEDGQQEEGPRRPRRPRPKAEDMFASDSE